ncbi:hypothetical protein EMCRGX_G028293 [Ephydatia muelleri]
MPAFSPDAINFTIKYMMGGGVQEPNVETDHLESSTSGSVIRVLTLGSNLPGKMSAGPEGMHFFIKWSKTNQMGRCVQRTKGRHMCPVPAMEAYRECCHCSTHSSPLFHFKDGRTLTSKIHLSTPGMVELCGYNPAKYNTHIGAAMYSSCQNRPSH